MINKKQNNNVVFIILCLIFSNGLCTTHPVFVTGCFHGTMHIVESGSIFLGTTTNYILQELILFCSVIYLANLPPDLGLFPRLFCKQKLKCFSLPKVLHKLRHELDPLNFYLDHHLKTNVRLPSGSMVKNPPTSAGKVGSIPDQEEPTCHEAAKPLCLS